MLENFLGNTSVFYDENSTKVKNCQIVRESLNLGALALFLRKKSYMQTRAESSNGRPTGVTNCSPTVLSRGNLPSLNRFYAATKKK